MKSSIVLVMAAALVVSGVLCGARPASGEPDVRLKITSEGYTKIRIGFMEAKPKPEKNLRPVYDRFRTVVEGDLDMSGYFEIVADPSAADANAIIDAAMKRDHDDLTIEVRLGDRTSGASVFKRKYGSSADGIAATAHIVADDIVLALTGRPGIANTRIAFVAGDRGSSDLYMASLGGSQTTRLTQGAGTVMSPAWSPDGARLAYLSYQTGVPVLYVMDTATLAARRFTSFEGMNATPAWSPDGKGIAVTLSKDGNPEIYVIAVDGTYDKRITYYSGIDTSPSWAPNGLEIAFTSDRAGTPQIFVTDFEGLHVRQITTEGSYNTSPAWSPDGSLIAYVSRIDGKFQICTIDPFGVSGHVLTSSGNNESPDWSADGMHLVFSSTGDGNSGIYIMSRDGSGMRKVIDGMRRPRDPAWSPPLGYGKQVPVEG
jgi:TolB protein